MKLDTVENKRCLVPTFRIQERLYAQMLMGNFKCMIQIVMIIIIQKMFIWKKFWSEKIKRIHLV